MPAALQSYAPPSIAPAARDQGQRAFIRAIIANPVSLIPEAAYHQDVTTVSLLGRRIGVITSPAMLEDILIKRPGDFPKSNVDERIFKPALGSSLLIASGDDWRWKRRLAAPYFTPARLAQTVPAMVAPFEALAEAWQKAPRTVDVSDAMTDATLSVIAATVFTEPDARATAAISKALDAYLAPISWTVLYANLKLPAWLPHPGSKSMRHAQIRMRNLVLALIRRHRSAASAGVSDICTDLMHAKDPETGRLLTDHDLVDMLLTLVAAGHETSANALTWMLFCLAEQPGVQNELRAEIAHVAGNRAITAAELPRLEKTEAFAKEAMRLFPPAPLIGRQTTKTETFGDYTFPAGTPLFMPIYAIHRNSRIWPDPKTFDLTRFLGDAGKRIARTAYMPFGAGPRVCIGGTFAMMEIVAGLAALIRKVQFTTTPETRCEPIQRVTLRPKTDLRLAVASV